MPFKSEILGDFPYTVSEIIQKGIKIKKELLAKKSNLKELRVAVLSGSTTNEVVKELELFLLFYGFKPTFYCSGYNTFYSEALFPSAEFKSFKPDIIYVHTSWRNLVNLPTPATSFEQYQKDLEINKTRFLDIWTQLSLKFDCPIIQNNFDACFYRPMGNMDNHDFHGINNFINKMNAFLYESVTSQKKLFINDLNYIQAKYGIDEFSDPKYWYLYKYFCAPQYIPYFTYNLANIIKAIFGKNKKVLNLDLDNTLWGDVIGDVGKSGIILGQGNGIGEAYQEFQLFLKCLKERGILLTVNSKNEFENAKEGFEHPDTILRIDDFVAFYANWQTKNVNLYNTAKELNLGIDSFVFVDDNPLEREIITSSYNDVSVPKIDDMTYAINYLCQGGYFEPVSLSSDDLARTKMYIDNKKRETLEKTFDNYDDFLDSLDMEAIISPFDDTNIERITQLLNKTNQFNLTTCRHSLEEIKLFAKDNDNICIYGRLKDKFGDNGLVSVIIAKKIEEQTLQITDWVMSCRVFNRGMEYAMFNAFALIAKQKDIKFILGNYIPTAKNKIVEDLYLKLGFKEIQKNKFELNLKEFKQITTKIRY